ncbi:MAG: FKBP-type peptidyl-prolyl cis-trans isomerase [Bdellovibrionales bacterium]
MNRHRILVTGLSAAAVVIVVLLIVMLTSNKKMKSPKQQASYTIGAQFGKSLKAQNLDLDTAALAAGIIDGYNGGPLKMTEAEMDASMRRLGEEQQQAIRAESARNKEKSDAFLTKNRSQPNVKVTASGLQYKIIQSGSGPSPKGDDWVVVKYKGTLVDGTEFDSSYRRNAPAEFPLKGVIPGWTEGLRMMKKGGKAVFYVPPELAYGDRPRQNIPGSSALIFEVELLDVKSPKGSKTVASVTETPTPTTSAAPPPPETKTGAKDPGKKGSSKAKSTR